MDAPKVPTGWFFAPADSSRYFLPAPHTDAIAFIQGCFAVNHDGFTFQDPFDNFNPLFIALT